MPLRIACPAGHKLIVPEDRAGKTLRCPRCDAAIVVPGERVQSSAFRVEEAENRASAVDGQESSVAVVARVSSQAEVPQVRQAAEPAVKPKSRAKQQSVVFEPAAVEKPPVPEVVLPVPAIVEAVVEPAAVVTEVVVAAENVSTASPECVTATTVTAAMDAAPATFVEPEQVATPQVAPQAVTLDPHWLPGVYSLAAALLAAALFGIAPAVWDVVEYVRFYDAVAAPQVARWALLLLLLGLIQAAYACYLFQLPDWSSVWVVTLYSLALAGLYALMLGLVLISREDGLLVGPHGLQLADKLAGGQAALWCLAMTGVSIIVAFFAGRLSLQWRRAEAVLRGAGQ